jgi:hypothetical protein
MVLIGLLDKSIKFMIVETKQTLKLLTIYTIRLLIMLIKQLFKSISRNSHYLHHVGIE